MKVIAILLFCYIVVFPFGQLTRVPNSVVSRLIISCPPPRSQMFLLRQAQDSLCRLAGVFRLFSSPEIHLYLTDIILFLLLCAWGIWRFWLVKKEYRQPYLTLPIFSFSVISLLSLGLASPLLERREVAVAGLYWLRWSVYAGLYFVLVDLKNQFKWLNRENLLNFLIGLGVMVAIFGLVQYFLWPNLRPLEDLGWDPHYYRVVGSFLDPGLTGIILVLTMILIVEKGLSISRGWPQILSPRRRATARPPSEVEASNEFLVVFGLVTYLALALTYSRASYLAYIVGIAVIAWLRKTPKLFVGAVLIGLLTLLILPRPLGEGGKLSRTYSIEARIKNWRHSLTIAQDHLVFGAGFNAYRYVQRDYGFLNREEWQMSHSGAGADSSILFVLATTGIFGLGAYLWIWGKAMVGGFYSPPRSPFGKPSTRAQAEGLRTPRRRDQGLILASLAAVFVHSWFLNSLFYPWVMAWFWILLATESN